MIRDIDDVVQELRKAHDNEMGATLLIGAGCSVKAGIPLAAGFVDRIRDDFPRDYERAKEKTYAHCMGELKPGQRRDLIASYVREAKVNWAHVCIATLMREGYVDRVLTTNFDNLVVRACAMLGEFPAVYDLAGSQLFKAADIPRKALFYLHGQHTGFVLRNTMTEVQEQSKALGPVFDDNGRRRAWMVVGYSGLHDPVFEHLAAVPQFDYGLYWVGYEDQEPAEHIRSRLLRADKYAYHVGGFDADSFFVTLCQKLRIFPPDFLKDPFSHIERILETLTPYTLPGERAEEDVTRSARMRIQKAREVLDRATHLAAGSWKGATDATDLDTRIVSAFMAGNYEDVVAMTEPVIESLSAEATDLVAWAYVMIGNRLAEQAKVKSGEEADRLLTEAGEKYEAGLTIKPNMHEALNNWGAALANWATRKEAEESERLFAEAEEKFNAALKMEPDDHEVLSNWGNSLSDWALRKEGEEADRLFIQAGEKYAAALKINPDNHDALYNWGTALSDWALRKGRKEVDRLLVLAGEKYAAALKVKPDKHEALYNWGNALLARARRKTAGEEAERLLIKAGEKYEAALKIEPDKHKVLNNWGTTLLDRARWTEGEEGERLFAQAAEKYEAALTIEPDIHEALYNWGLTLSGWARRKSGKDAERLLTQAGEKFAAALEVKPDNHEVLVDWGNALFAQARWKRKGEAEQLFTHAGEKYAAALKIKPDEYQTLNRWGLVFLVWSGQKEGEDAELLRMRATELFTQVEAIQPGYSAYNLGCLYAQTGDEVQCREWLERSHAAGKLPSRAHLLDDPGLESVRGTSWFQEFLAKAKD